MQLRQYVLIARRWLWLVVLLVGVAAVASYLASSRTPKLYQSTTTLLVNQAQNPGTMVYTDILTSERLTRTYSELIRQPPVLDAAVADLGLLYSAGQLDAMLSVQVVRDTMLLKLRAESTIPQEAADVANAVARAFIKSNQETILGQATRSRDALREQLSELERSIRATSSQLDRLRSSATDGRTPEARQAEVSRLQDLLSQYQLIYSQLLKSDQDMQMAEARAFSTVSVVAPAQVPTAPVRPRVLQDVMVAAAIGLMLSIGLVFLFEYLDDTVKSGDQIQRLLGAPALGYVLMMRRKKEQGSLSVADLGPRSPVVEAFRVLRANLQFSLLDKPGRAILVTSAGPGEGKTTVAANLAQVIAQAGKRVILVDVDLRRPSLHRFFGVVNDAGATTALMEPQSLDAGVIRPTKVENLMLVTAGPLPPNPSELLGSPRMSALVEALKSRADVVLFDSPPALVVSDPAVLARAMDAVLLVVDTASTRAAAIVRTRESLERAAGPGKLVGAVLNKLAANSAGYYYYYYYYQRYGYGPEGSNGANGQKATPSPRRDARSHPL